MRDPGYQPIGPVTGEAKELRPPGAEAADLDITRDRKRFIPAVRARVSSFLRAWSIGDGASAVDTLDGLRDRDGELWTPERLKDSWEAYCAEHAVLRFDPEARNLRHTHVTPGETLWKIEQMLVDPEMHNDWVAEFEVDLAASRDANEHVIFFNRLGSFAGESTEFDP